MSDKVTKVRINGVEKEVAGSGSGGVSGAYLAPKRLVSPEYTGFNQAAINPIALVEQLEKAGVAVNELVMNPNENNVYLAIGHLHTYEGSDAALFNLHIARSEFGFAVQGFAMGISIQGEVPDDKDTLSEIIEYIFTEMYPELYFTLDSVSGSLENFIIIHYQNANETLHYYISNMTEFCEEVIIKYNSSSDSSN